MWRCDLGRTSVADQTSAVKKSAARCMFGIAMAVRSAARTEILLGPEIKAANLLVRRMQPTMLKPQTLQPKGIRLMLYPIR